MLLRMSILGMRRDVKGYGILKCSTRCLQSKLNSSVRAVAMTHLWSFNTEATKCGSRFYAARSMCGASPRAATGAKLKTFMTPVRDHRDRVTQPRSQRRSLLADGIIAFLTAVLLTSTITAVGALAPVVWNALSQASAAKSVTNPRQCAEIDNDKDRLACFDNYVEGMTRPPAKGAFAPPQAFGETIRKSDKR
jgi:hypothetical protein